MMKKLLALLLIAVLAVLSASCSSGGSSQKTSGSSAAEETAQKQVEETKPEESGPSYKVTNTYFELEKNSLGERIYTGIVEITNTGDTNLYLKSCTFDLEDDKGHLLHTDDEYQIGESPNIIAPGEKGYFYNMTAGAFLEDFSIKNGVNLKPDVEVVEAKGDPTDFEVSDVSLTKDSFGPKITGRVKNTSDEEEDSLSVDVLYYNKSGKVIGIASGSVSDLKPGKKKSFEISGMNLSQKVKNGKYSKYKVFSRATHIQL